MTDQDKRRDDRLPVLWHGKLTTEDDREFDCQIRDVSLAGTLITCDADIKMGEELLLTIDKIGEFASVVKWQGSQGLGLMILAGPDLVLKKFAEGAGGKVSDSPHDLGTDPLAS
ncbi:PilZ domain-containing protein [Kordiimonas aestuarii]|uniref:PilZ domain-containing protein n=1 Tax=Kordiimonas aestuarii TaxID=1005925 RepID=UPI0021D265DB|nr:PilZ domain-containing protein [Kordiimonas aestuarii]